MTKIRILYALYCTTIVLVLGWAMDALVIAGIEEFAQQEEDRAELLFSQGVAVGKYVGRNAMLEYWSTTTTIPKDSILKVDLFAVLNLEGKYMIKWEEEYGILK